MTFRPLFSFRLSRPLVGLLSALCLVFTGCVSTQQYEALQSQLDEAEAENASLRLSRQDAEIASRGSWKAIAKLTDQNASLNEDLERIGAQAKRLREEVGPTLGAERRPHGPEFGSLGQHCGGKPTAP